MEIENSLKNEFLVKKNNQHYVRLTNGIEMPMIGLGTSLRGKKTKTDSNDFVASVKYAIDEIGYRHIDTAKAYNNEHLVGEAIRTCGVPREELFITSKLYPEDMGYEKTLKAFEKCCKQLQLDYLDLYLIHFPGMPINPNGKKPQFSLEKSKELRLETWRALEKLYAEGKCKCIGVSNYMPRHLEEIVEAKMSLPIVNQCEFHPYYSNKTVFDACKQMGIQFQGYSPLGKGALLDDPVIVQLAEKYSKTPAQIAIRWSMQNNVIVIPGSTNSDRIKENFNVNDFSLNDSEINLIWTLNKNEKVSWDPTNVV